MKIIDFLRRGIIRKFHLDCQPEMWGLNNANHEYRTIVLMHIMVPMRYYGLLGAEFSRTQTDLQILYRNAKESINDDC